MIYQNLLRPLLFQLDPETAHHLTFSTVGKLQHARIFRAATRALFNRTKPRHQRTLKGLMFPNPVGIAAGFDKNGLLPDLLFDAGYGHVEIGSITAKPSVGNPRPRLFRLPADRALINRMGLNNDGADEICKRLRNRKFAGVLGINIAKTHDPFILGDAAIDDYLYSFSQAVTVADYITINVSCPNTTEGKTFEDPSAFNGLITALRSHPDFKNVPVLVKLSADLSADNLELLSRSALDAGFAGFVAVNTSLDRSGLQTKPHRLSEIGRGGLSGAPIREKALNIVRHLRSLHGKEPLIIAAGGIENAATAIERLDAGADLIQVYTGLIYHGPSLGGTICQSIR